MVNVINKVRNTVFPMKYVSNFVKYATSKTISDVVWTQHSFRMQN